MLTIYEMAHAVPAFLITYGGVRAMFNHEVGVYATIVVATVVLLGTWISLPMVNDQIDLRINARRSE